MNTTELMSRRAVAEIVGEDAAVLVARIDHAEMNHGEHWVWTTEQAFTRAGVQLLVERLAETHGGASLALRAEAARLFSPLVAVPVPAAHNGAHPAPSRDRANGYQPEPEDAA